MGMVGMEEGYVPQPFIRHIKHVQVRLEKKWLAGLISTPEFVDQKEGALSVWKRVSLLHPASLLFTTPSKSSIYHTLYVFVLHSHIHACGNTDV